MTPYDTLRLKYSYKKGSRLISINKDLHHHIQHFQNIKALNNKLYLSTRSEHNVERDKFGYHRLLGTYPT